MKTTSMKFRYVLFAFLCVGVLTTASQPVFAQTGDVDESTGEVIELGEAVPCSESMLGFPAWYRGLTTDGTCDIKSPAEVGGIAPFIWTIVLNLVEILLRLAGFAAAFFIIYGGYKYMISAGSPDGIVGAKKTILNAVVGLVLSIAAVAIVRTVSIGIGLGG